MASLWLVKSDPFPPPSTSPDVYSRASSPKPCVQDTQPRRSKSYATRAASGYTIARGLHCAGDHAVYLRRHAQHCCLQHSSYIVVCCLQQMRYSPCGGRRVHERHRVHHWVFDGPPERRGPCTLVDVPPYPSFIRSCDVGVPALTCDRTAASMSACCDAKGHEGCRAGQWRSWDS